MKLIKKALQSFLKKIIWFLTGVIIASVLMVASLNLIDPPTWAWKIQRQISPPKTYPERSQHQWVEWAKISSNMKLSVIAAEDQLFSQHYGFDYQSIMKALDSNAQGKPVRGASTISQQTIKNLFLWSGKSFFRKGLEAWLTGLMEILLEKQRILTLYLNIVEFGPGIYGVEAASQSYYKTSASQLSAQQAARLASVLPNPYVFHVKRPSQYLIKRTQWIQKQMRQLGQSAIP